MKKWMYLIFPGGLLILFLAFYFADAKRVAERDRIHAQQVIAMQKAEADKQAELKRKAEEDARDRAAKRAADEAKKEADKLAKWNADGQKIKDETDRANAESDKSTKKIAELEAELNTLRGNREKANREYLELLKGVELAKIERRNAELEIQRTTEMISRKAAESLVPKVPAAPAPAS